MKKKLSFSFILVFLGIISLFAQNNYYYLNKKKVFLEIDKQKINVFVNDTVFDKEVFKNLKIRDFVFKKNSDYEDWATLQFDTILDDISYFKICNSIKNSIGVESIAPFFKLSDSKSIGTSNVFYVKLKKLEDYPLLKAKAVEKNVTIVEQLKLMPLWVELKTTKATIESSFELTNIFYETGMFDGIDPSFVFDYEIGPVEELPDSESSSLASQLDCTSNDPLYNQQWGLTKIKACQAWNIAQGDNIKVAVVDSGIDLTNNDLSVNIFPQSYEYQVNTLEVSPSVTHGYHGTHIAGIIAASKDNNSQIAGVAPNSKVISLSVSTSQDGSHNNVNIVKNFANAIHRAVEMGADVINCSWHLNDVLTTIEANAQSQLVNNAIDYALYIGRGGKGCIVVFAAGNTGDSFMTYPANYSPDILTVGNCEINNIRHNGTGTNNSSNYGPGLDLVAPGTNIISTVLNNQTNTDTGTSMAAPHVAAVAALILSVNPCLRGWEVRKIIESTTQKLGNYSYTITTDRPNGTWNNEMGYGVVNALAAVQMAKQMQAASSLDLYIQDDAQDIGIEANPSTTLWDSPDIWVRNYDDDQDYNETPRYNPFSPNYVYVRVHNNSCYPSIGNEKLDLYYSLPSDLATNDTYANRTSFLPIAGYNLTLINSQTMPVIPAGEDAIVKFAWDFPDPLGITSCSDNSFNTFLLAKIVATNDPNHIPETSNIYTNIKNNNNIAGKNVIPVNTLSLSSTIPGNSSTPNLAIVNPFDDVRDFRIEMIQEETETGKPIFKEAEVKFKMDETLYNAWQRGGKLAQNIGNTIDEKKKQINDDNVLIDNINLNPNEKGSLQFFFNFLMEELTNKTNYKYHIFQRDKSTNEIVGGMTFEITKNNRNAFKANAGDDKEVDKNEFITISASTINEPVIYNWHDIEGNLIYSGKDFAVSTEIAKKYKLEVIALSDGFKDYDEVSINLNPNSLSPISPNPATDKVTIFYKINQAQSAYLMILGGYETAGISNNYILDTNSSNKTIDLMDFQTGFYTVVLICDGKIVDTKTLVVN